ncbi:hypothetical protein BDW74DRAFT_171363 [Aspergillus multicolor]|uniref:mitochondrial 37S ribosomal protein uS9m n=1 Tax=Aspergillus multicolor TaxID=41759 RepID=UPI003CCCDC1D
MSWKNPYCVAHAMQSVRSATYLRAALAQRSAAPSYLAAGRTMPLKQQTSRCYATEATQAPMAAAEIDFGNMLQKRSARVVPASPSYFTGSPRFFDHLLNLENLSAKYAALPTVAANDAPRMAWLKLPAFRDLVGERVPSKKYKGLLKVLQRLNRIDPAIRPQEVRLALKEFLRPGNPYIAKATTIPVDELGRARGKGKRKESSAVVSLVEGDGEVRVNGKSLVEAFPRVHDRESATWALRSSNRLDKYNVWATVSGGGTTGQAEAIALALGRALMVHEPALKPILRKAGVITVDARRVERKKPGRVKARKAPTWVKR